MYANSTSEKDEYEITGEWFMPIDPMNQLWVKIMVGFGHRCKTNSLSLQMP
jgi:hypothetical protein